MSEIVHHPLGDSSRLLKDCVGLLCPVRGCLLQSSVVIEHLILFINIGLSTDWLL